MKRQTLIPQMSELPSKGLGNAGKGGPAVDSRCGRCGLEANADTRGVTEPRSCWWSRRQPPAAAVRLLWSRSEPRQSGAPPRVHVTGVREAAGALPVCPLVRNLPSAFNMYASWLWFVAGWVCLALSQWVWRAWLPACGLDGRGGFTASLPRYSGTQNLE